MLLSRMRTDARAPRAFVWSGGVVRAGAARASAGGCERARADGHVGDQLVADTHQRKLEQVLTVMPTPGSLAPETKSPRLSSASGADRSTAGRSAARFGPPRVYWRHRVTLQQVRDLPARSTSPACASRLSAAVTACGLGPQPAPVISPMWWLISLGFITAGMPLSVGLRRAAST